MALLPETPLSITDVAVKTGINPGTVRRQIYEMNIEGYAKRTATGLYIRGDFDYVAPDSVKRRWRTEHEEPPVPPRGSIPPPRHRSLTAMFFGDPPIGRSALDKLKAGVT